MLTVDIYPKIKSSNSGLFPKLLKLILNREAMKSQRERKGHVRSEDGVSHMPEGQEIRHLNSLITSFSDLNQWHTLMFLQTVLTLQFVCSACWVQLHVIIMEHACVILQLDSAIHSARLQPSHHTSSCRLGRKNLLQVDILLPWAWLKTAVQMCVLDPGTYEPTLETIVTIKTMNGTIRSVDFPWKIFCRTHWTPLMWSCGCSAVRPLGPSQGRTLSFSWFRYLWHLPPLRLPLIKLAILAFHFGHLIPCIPCISLRSG